MGRNVSYVRRRGYTYAVMRDSRGRFTRFSRSRGEALPFTDMSAVGEKHISLYGTAATFEGIYKARVDAHGSGRDLYYLIMRLKEGYVPRRSHRHVYGSVDRIEDNFF